MIVYRTRPSKDQLQTCTANCTANSLVGLPCETVRMNSTYREDFRSTPSSMETEMGIKLDTSMMYGTLIAMQAYNADPTLYFRLRSAGHIQLGTKRLESAST
jgi:hypothetical protein